MQQLIFHPLFIILITLGLGVFWWSLYQTSLGISNSTNDTAVMEEEIQALSGQIDDLEQKINHAQQPLTKETIIRNELLMQLPGEKVVKLPDATPPSASDNRPDSTTAWQAWQKLLF